MAPETWSSLFLLAGRLTNPGEGPVKADG